MTSGDERLKILALVEQNKITPEEGIRLLQALDRTDVHKNTPSVPPRPPAAGSAARWLRVCITDMSSGKVRVNIRLPVTVLNTGMRIGARFSTDISQLEMGQIMDAIQSGETGKILDVFNDEDGEHIVISLE